MTFIVDQLFPPHNGFEETINEFSNVNYWRDQLLDISDDMLVNLNESSGSQAVVEIGAENLTIDKKSV